ncbi:MAG: DUF4132 domain-containing protein [Chloroflexi bacterium]|nr:DUF4132 domain-containing protein [Chloroflexota bacterium]
MLVLPTSTEQLDLITRFIKGELNPPGKIYFSISQPSVYDVGHWIQLLNHLERHGQLSYELFCAAVDQMPHILVALGIRRDQYNIGLQISYHTSKDEIVPEYRPKFLQYTDRLAWEWAQNISTTDKQQRLICIAHLYGSRYLLLAAQYHVEYQLGKLTDVYGWTTPEQAVRHLAGAEAVEPTTEAERAELIQTLKQFPRETLMALFPVATHSRNLLVEALGWQDAIPVIELVFQIAEQEFETEGYAYRDIPNSIDPASGVLDFWAVQAVFAKFTNKRLAEIFKFLRQSGAGIKNTLTLLEAVVGLNGEKVEKGMKHDSQIAIKAYGLLPLERGDAEIMERYVALKTSAASAKQFGQRRRLTHAAAAQAGLANLAQVAGYENAHRLEWAMEAKIGQEIAPAGRTWQIGEYCVTLSLDDADVSVVVRKGERTLKSVPLAVRGTVEYLEVKEAISQIRAQAGRLRSELETLLASGEWSEPDQLQNFLNLSIGRAFLGKLLLRFENGAIGLLEPEEFAVRDLHGQLFPIDMRVMLAHPYHLYQAESLAAWQREIVHRRITQPFKQAFRELYLLTPAERETHIFSNRFAGHVLDARIAGKLFGTRGWRVTSGDVVVPYKVFRGMRAVFELPDAYHYLGGDTPITTDRIYFQSSERLSLRNWQRDEESMIPIENVPPLVFSEVMRDADLIVSVAQWERDNAGALSPESYQRRGELITTLLDELGLPGVTVEGHFAYVTGKLAKYRVHLGSAVIHIEPGNYLCIVPDRWGKTHEKLFLPFADGYDTKASEVISKILLLVADDKIKDQSILAQIKRA